MPFQLVVLRGRSAINHHRLGPGVTVVGRQEGCQLQIKSSQVSRKHCELFEKAGRLIVKDLNSSNGTFVNGEKVEGQQAVSSGDEISIGGVKFRVETVGAAAKPGDTAVPTQPVISEAVAVAADDDAIPIDDGDTVMESPLEIEVESEGTNPEVVAVDSVVEPETEPEPDAGPELGEDAVAEFLMDLDVDENDKM